ncbi:MAG TPA: PPOX class F420-dependent oxidoreductase [Streptosporangiaceae bacterium]|jgi:pyridoxamine 5'-phosphate oxidase family protein|nr:PPOX class F420-dependent oxidoreductase [Streptosporangiaceae bacterium]
MALTGSEQAYLAAQPRGRLATVAPDGSPQNKPVGFRYNPGLGTIDIYGFNMEQSRKFRNVQANPRVAFVVDDAPGQGAEGMRFMEIRGVAETATGQDSPGHASAHLIRIHPRRVVSWNLDPARPGLQTRDVDAVRPGEQSPGEQRAGEQRAGEQER